MDRRGHGGARLPSGDEDGREGGIWEPTWPILALAPVPSLALAVLLWQRAHSSTRSAGKNIARVSFHVFVHIVTKVNDKIYRAVLLRSDNRNLNDIPKSV